MRSYLGQRKPPRLSLQGKPGILQEADYLQHYSNHRHYNPSGFDKTTTRSITEPFSQITSKKLRFLSRPPGAKDHGELNCGIAVPLPRWKTVSRYVNQEMQRLSASSGGLREVAKWTVQEIAAPSASNFVSNIARGYLWEYVDGYGRCASLREGIFESLPIVS